MPTITELWDQIHAWLSHHAPRILKNLNPPATDQELDAVQRIYGCQMPDDWKELYRVHSGMNSENNFGSLFYTMQFLSLDEVIREHANSNTNGAKPHPVRTCDPGVSKHDMHNPKWIPFAHDRGETLLRIDLDPASEGTGGQVIFTDHADDTVIVLASSLRTFLEGFVNDLQTDMYFLNKEALESGDEFLACNKDIDVINWAFSPRWRHLK